MRKEYQREETLVHAGNPGYDQRRATALSVRESVTRVARLEQAEMSYCEKAGNLFASRAEALVNTVNCVGPMGKGIALEFRRRFPEMFEAYKAACERKHLRPGQILPYRKSKPWILNFAVKDDWKNPSRLEWIEMCLDKFCRWYPSVGLRSVAFPWMGAMNGRIPLTKIKEVTRRYLQPLKNIDVEVYTFDPDSPDPLFEALLNAAKGLTEEEFCRRSMIKASQSRKLYELIADSNPKSLTQIVESGVLGKTSLDRLYSFLVEFQRRKQTENSGVPQLTQARLF